MWEWNVIALKTEQDTKKGHDCTALNRNCLCYPLSCKGMDDKNAAKLNELIQAG